MRCVSLPADPSPGLVYDQVGTPVCAAVVTCSLAVPSMGVTGPPSVRHLYWTSRELAGRGGLPGTRMSDCMRAWSEIGLVPESQWPWADDGVDRSPPPELLGRGRHTCRVVSPRERGEALPEGGEGLVASLRALIREGWAFSLEFPLHPRQFLARHDGVLPLVPADGPSFGRHVVLVDGFDDDLELREGDLGQGGFRFLNSWGPGWGRAGQGWLPYDYVRRSMVRDVWVVVPSGSVGPSWIGMEPVAHPRAVRLDDDGESVRSQA